MPSRGRDVQSCIGHRPTSDGACFLPAASLHWYERVRPEANVDLLLTLLIESDGLAVFDLATSVRSAIGRWRVCSRRLTGVGDSRLTR